MPERRSPSLDQLERWMLKVITDPEGVDAGLERDGARRELPLDAAADLGAVVQPSRALTSLERLRIYGNMYLWRLIDVLWDDFPTTRHFVGDDRFAELARGYIAAHPSRHYDLARFAHAFPAYLAGVAPELPNRAFVSEIAALERSLDEVFNAARAEPVGIDDLLAIPQERWGEAVFETIPALQLHPFDFPVNEVFERLRAGEEVEIPGPRETWVRVHRYDLAVYRTALTREQFHLLTALREQLPLAAALEKCLAEVGCDPELLIPQLREWFQEWTSEGLFASVRLSE